MFHDKFSQIYNDCIPLISKKIWLDRPYKSWITKGLIKSIHQKNWLYNEAMKKKTDISISKYKIYKNKLIKIIISAEKTYFAKRFNEAKDNTKNVWFEIKPLIIPNTSKCFQIKDWIRSYLSNRKQLVRIGKSCST